MTDTPTPASGAYLPTGSVNALTTLPTDPATLVQDLIKALETPGTTVETLATYVGEAVALAGFVVGAFDHPIGLAISAVPQATILAASTVIAGGLAIFRMLTKSRKQLAAARLVGDIHYAHAAATQNVTFSRSA